MENSKKTPTQKIFDAIEEQLETGTVPWHKPWVVKSDGIVSHKESPTHSVTGCCSVTRASTSRSNRHCVKAGA